ncbi:MAG: response regulator [Planctomycetota bacterium]|jgi:DNA-binding response OmpR family regulator
MSTHRKILAVDEDPDQGAIVEELFGDKYDLRIAATGVQALGIAADFLPDIILLNTTLPDMDGYEVCRQLRRRASLSQARIIMVTAKGTLEDKVAGYAAGANDFITEPFTEEDILESVQFFLWKCGTSGRE